MSQILAVKFPEANKNLLKPDNMTETWEIINTVAGAWQNE